MKKKITVTKTVTKTITHCYQNCPYFSYEGMERVMVCGHPDLSFKKTGDHYAGYIIDWSEPIKTGFPSKCPLLK